MFINWKRLLLAVYRLEEGQQEILGRLDRMGTPHPPQAVPLPLEGKALRKDEWVQEGIDNILSYSVEKKEDE